VVLPADVLAAARLDLADLRVVDADGAQRPYLLGEAESLRVSASVEPRERGELEPGWSRYAVALPVARIAPSSITLVTSSALVAREVAVFGYDDERREHELGSAWLARTPGQDESLSVSLSGVRVAAIELRVYDGDEVPLVIEQVLATVPTRTLFVVAPAGEYRALVGAPQQTAPTYDIARARPLILAVAAGAATLGPAAPNPSFVAPGWVEREGAETIVVWAVLIVAVLVLGGITLRAARSEPPKPAPLVPEPPASGPHGDGGGADSAPIADSAAPGTEAAPSTDAAPSAAEPTDPPPRDRAA
jgi:hypothetical protein